MVDPKKLKDAEKRTLLGLLQDSFRPPRLTDEREDHVALRAQLLYDALCDGDGAIDVTRHELIWMLLGVAYEIKYGGEVTN